MKKVLEKVKSMFNEKTIITGLILARAFASNVAYAAGGINTGVSELDDLFNKIILVLGGLVSGYGILKLINGVRAWSDANEEMDNARKSQGMQTMISGGLCALVLPVVAYLGYAIS